MCVYSMIGDHVRDYLPNKHPNFPWSLQPGTWPPSTTPTPVVSKEDFDALKKDVEQIRDLLKRALKYDEENDEPHCEVDEKVAFIKTLAEYLDVDMSEVLPKES